MNCTIFRKSVAVLLSVAMLCSSLSGYPLSSDATPQAGQVNRVSTSNLPMPGTPLSTSPAFNPLVLKGLILDQNNPLRFHFIVDEGNNKLSDLELKEQTQLLLNYFLAALALPESEIWVNLSPYEQDRIIPDKLGRTEMGKELLGQDYILKQLAASLTHPDTELGKRYWDTLNNYKSQITDYKLPNGRVGANDHSPATQSFNKVWIIPDKAVVYQDKDRVYIGEAHLKVMMEEDYLAMQNNLKSQISNCKLPNGNDNLKSEICNLQSNTNAFKTQILPTIEKEVNTGKNFATLRQIYHSLILAIWFKKALKETILYKGYADKQNTKGIDTIPLAEKNKIYARYLEAFQKGAYNLVKREQINYKSQITNYKLGYAGTRKITKRAYFSGGFLAEGGENSLQGEPLVEMPTQPGTQREVVAVIESPAAPSFQRMLHDIDYIYLALRDRKLTREDFRTLAMDLISLSDQDDLASTRLIALFGYMRDHCGSSAWKALKKLVYLANNRKINPGVASLEVLTPLVSAVVSEEITMVTLCEKLAREGKELDGMNIDRKFADTLVKKITAELRPESAVLATQSTSEPVVELEQLAGQAPDTINHYLSVAFEKRHLVTPESRKNIIRLVNKASGIELYDETSDIELADEVSGNPRLLNIVIRLLGQEMLTVDNVKITAIALCEVADEPWLLAAIEGYLDRGWVTKNNLGDLARFIRGRTSVTFNMVAASLAIGFFVGIAGGAANPIFNDVRYFDSLNITAYDMVVPYFKSAGIFGLASTLLSGGVMSSLWRNKISREKIPQKLLELAKSGKMHNLAAHWQVIPPDVVLKKYLKFARKHLTADKTTEEIIALLSEEYNLDPDDVRTAIESASAAMALPAISASQPLSSATTEDGGIKIDTAKMDLQFKGENIHLSQQQLSSIPTFVDGAILHIIKISSVRDVKALMCAAKL